MILTPGNHVYFEHNLDMISGYRVYLNTWIVIYDV